MTYTTYIATVVAAGLLVSAIIVPLLNKQKNENVISEEIIDGVPGMIGNTPLIRIKSLSEALGCDILAKNEASNPGGSSKDRIALQMIRDAEAAGLISPGDRLVEGTSGSTGISLAMLSQALGYKCTIVLSDDVAHEKINMLRLFGAEVQLTKPAAIVNDENYVNRARVLAESINESAKQSGERAFFCDQFENPSNFRAHYLHTGPEIWRQTKGKVDAFVCGAGTGGTIAGVGTYLKERLSVLNQSLMVVLADPPGSSLLNKVKYGVAYAPQQAERLLKRHRYDTIIEGVGLDRITQNFAKGEGIIDDAYAVTDAEAVAMSRYILANEGMFIGCSTAMNLVAVVKLARKIGPGKRIVTLLCDPGHRHVSRFWNEEFLASRGLAGACNIPKGSQLSFIA